MWDMDWVGPITPACSATGAAYVLLVIPCQFTWLEDVRYRNFKVGNCIGSEILQTLLHNG